MIATLNELSQLFYHIHEKPTRIGITSGCFDLLHYYHLHFFERCKAHCDVLVVGVDSDDLVLANKKKTPVIPEFHRAQMVNALRCVDAVFVMRHLDQLQAAINACQADVMFKNAPTIYDKPVIESCRENDVKPTLIIIPDVAELTSTSAIIATIQRGGGANG